MCFESLFKYLQILSTYVKHRMMAGERKYTERMTTLLLPEIFAPKMGDDDSIELQWAATR